MKLLEMIKPIYISCLSSNLEVLACKKIKDLTFLSWYKTGNIPEISNFFHQSELLKNYYLFEVSRGASEIHPDRPEEPRCFRGVSVRFVSSLGPISGCSQLI